MTALIIVTVTQACYKSSGSKKNCAWQLGISCNFYSTCALLAMQSAVLARGILSVRLSVRHVPVLCPNE